MTSIQSQDTYVMEKNDGELQRLANHHELITKYLGALVLAPVDFSQPNLRILDSGTADGLWLRDLKDSINISHTYVGTDITEAWFPRESPHGLSFRIQSITQPWPQDWLSTFHYVHQRLTMVGVGPGSVDNCVMNLANLLRPEGYLELVEADFTGDSSNGPAGRYFELLMEKFLDTIGIGYTYAKGLQVHMKNAGLVNIQTRTFTVRYGAACEDATLGTKGVSHLLSAARGMLNFLQGQPNAAMHTGIPETFLEDLEIELHEKGASFRMIAVWAQKPAGDNTGST